jgi:hypothetical protein
MSEGTAERVSVGDGVVAVGAAVGVVVGAAVSVVVGASVGAGVGVPVGVGEGLEVGVSNRVRAVRTLSSKGMQISQPGPTVRTCRGRGFLKLRGGHIHFTWGFTVAATAGTDNDSEACLSRAPKCKDRACKGNFHCGLFVTSSK